MSAAAAPVVPYRIIADCFRSRSVVPFLGAAASFSGAPKDKALPSGAAFGRLLAELCGYPGSGSDPLTKVAQYLEEVPADRKYLLSTICTKFYDEVDEGYRAALTDFLTGLPKALVPRLMVTTNYDVLVERTLEGRGIPYLAISHIMKGSKYSGRLLCYGSLHQPLTEANIRTLKQIEDELLEVQEQPTPPVLIYKMHGTAWLRCGEMLLDSVVLTENDYIDFFAKDMLAKIPTRILEGLRVGRLLFLGYSLEDWNFRVLLRKLGQVQRPDADDPQRHWAFLLDADDVEIKFWDRRGVTVYRQPLEQFLPALSQSLP